MTMHLTEGSGKRLVRVRVVGVLERLLGGSELPIEAEGSSSLIEVLRSLPDALRSRVLNGEEIASDILVLVNGVEVSCLGSPKEITVSKANINEVVLIPVIHGG